MKAFFLLVVVVGAAIADEAVKVVKPVVVEAKVEEKKLVTPMEKSVAAVATSLALLEKSVAEMEKSVVKVEEKGVELGSRTGAGDVGERSAVPAAPIYPYPYPSYYWPYYVPLAAPSQLARSEGSGVVNAVPYYTYPYAYTYPYYTYPYAPVVAAAPAPASVYYGTWKK